MLNQTEGIILKSFNYGEHHKIIKILTPSLGVIGVFVTGANKVGAKKSVLVEPLTLAHFNLKQTTNAGSDLYYLASGDALEYFLDLKLDYEKVSYFYYMAEIIIKGLHGGEDSAYVYRLLKKILLLADAGTSMYLLSLIFQLKMLPVLGIEPALDCCVTCGTVERIVMLSVALGGMVCANCKQLNEPLIIDAPLIPIVRAMAKVDLENFPEIELEPELLKPIEHFLESYYDSYSGLYLKSKHFLKQLK